MLFHLLEMFFRASVFVPDAVCFNAWRYPPSVMVLMRGQGVSGKKWKRWLVREK